MNIGTEQVFIVNTVELDQQNEHTSTHLQRSFAMPVTVAAMQPEDVQTSMCLQQSMGPPSRTQMCRLCATITELVVPIFQEEGLQNNLADKIHQHLPIKVSENDLLPVVMCFQCTSTLLAWHELVVCSVQADSVMRERFNLTFTHQQQHQPNVQSSQNQIKNEKCPPRAAPPLFLCAECDLYRNRGDMLAHMATHIVKTKGTKLPEELTLPDKTKNRAPKTIIPVRLQRILSEPAPPPPAEPSPATTPRLDSIPSASELADPPSVGALHPATSTPSPLQKVKANNLKREPDDAANENKKPANDVVPSERLAASDRKHSKEPEKTASPGRPDDFSDQSDTENEFGRLPESVFDAIEDSQDARSNDDGESPEAEKAETKKPNLPRLCPVCEKRCNSLSGWYYHLKRAHGTNESVACEDCDKVFASKSELARHARTHGEERPFACGACARASSSRAGRYVHERAHAGARRHACARCPRAFRWRAQLARHEARHEAAGRHACAQCGRGFSVAADLRRHERAHRPGCHRCAVCDAAFKQKRYLKVHMENVHSARIATSDVKKICSKPKRPVPPVSADSPLSSLSPGATGDI